MKFSISEPSGILREEDKQLFEYLCEEDSFKEIVTSARKALGLDEDNLPTSFTNAQIYLKTNNYADLIFEKYNLSKFWREPIRFFIVTGKIFPPGSSVIISGYSETLDPKTKEWKPPQQFQVTVTENIGFTTLIKELSRNQEYISSFLKKLPRKRRKMKSSELRLEIRQLIKEGWNKSKDIHDFLSSRYGDDCPSEQVINNWMRRDVQFLERKKIT